MLLKQQTLILKQFTIFQAGKGGEQYLMKVNKLIDKLLQVPNQEEDAWIQALTDDGHVFKIKVNDVVNVDGKTVIM